MVQKRLVEVATVGYALACGLLGVFYWHFSFWKDSLTRLAGGIMLLLAAVLLVSFLIGKLRPNRPCFWALVVCAGLLAVILTFACGGWLIYHGQTYRLFGAERVLSWRGVVFQALVLFTGLYVERGAIKVFTPAGFWSMMAL